MKITLNSFSDAFSKKNSNFIQIFSSNYLLKIHTKKIPTCRFVICCRETSPTRKRDSIHTHNTFPGCYTQYIGLIDETNHLFLWVFRTEKQKKNYFVLERKTTFCSQLIAFRRGKVFLSKILFNSFSPAHMFLVSCEIQKKKKTNQIFSRISSTF